LLDAAAAVFARYGFRRASMADIAAEAGVSRPALYLHFRSKKDVLASLAAAMRDRAMADATAVWREGAPFADNLEATLLGKELTFFAVLHASPHGDEIMAADADLTAEIARDLDASFRKLIARRLRKAARDGEIDLAVAEGDATGLADTIAASAKAIANSAADERVLRAGLRRLARLVAAACRRP
jgi:AcrR family transcriptional regulator